ncbi:hypothetical protein E1262_28480 [Jiangella aurantiaca]|uniref:DUF2188 domain-containing protein n=1 Tax=Jiangella aurantiaca TaxID=2530373 RepID=A0A4R4ZYL0_9ACTN|nr:hypothetical protein [Jiangella aurantiaca]TDD64361.1 hypothetical protein E1262_28480 [Jiangella aurantiaca]
MQLLPGVHRVLSSPAAVIETAHEGIEWATRRSDRGTTLARYKVNDKWVTVKNGRGETIRYGTKRAAKAAANAEEVKVRERTSRDPAVSRRCR